MDLERVNVRPENNVAGRNLQIAEGAHADSLGVSSSYVLGFGDSLYSVARKLNVSYEDLRSANGINDPRDLMVGQVLHVP